ncbi:MAG: hypothetical protein OEW15_13840 [Nitrospirota bacterium]|nr:hypothetical protein [Nitrospirota bacterium]
MRNQLKGIVVFLIMAAILLGALRLLSWIPEAFDTGSFRRFETPEEARSHTKIGQIYLPAFYPQSVTWPPTLIGAQTHPYPAVITEFSGKGREGVYLTITQTALSRRPLAARILMASVREKVTYPFKGRKALLEVGVCEDDKQCSKFSWDEGPFAMALIIRSAPTELVRMAESMIPREQDGHPAVP